MAKKIAELEARNRALMVRELIHPTPKPSVEKLAKAVKE
jgi:hypothetical protein